MQWYGEQLDEDERIARATLWDDDGALGSGGWYAYDRGPRDGFREARWVVIDRADEGVMDSRPQAADDQAVARHIAEHDPARVLREIDTKRRALDHYARICEHTKHGDEAYVLAEGAVAQQIKIMASGYSHRPGYREEWRPTV